MRIYEMTLYSLLLGIWHFINPHFIFFHFFSSSYIPAIYRLSLRSTTLVLTIYCFGSYYLLL